MITLEDCVYVPDIVVKLISPGLLAKKGCNITQQKDSFSITRNNNIVLKGLVQDHLFVIRKPQTAGSNQTVNLSNQPSSIPSLLLKFHRTFGHASISTLKPLLKDGYPNKDLLKFQCNSCVESKITKAPFSSVSTSPNKPLEQIHLDLIGPISPQSKSSHHYLLTLVNNCTGYLVAFPLKSKDKTPNTIINILETKYKRLN